MSRTKPYRYQEKGVRKIWHFDGRALLADDMGLGKTLQALLFGHEAARKGPIVVICPAGLKEQWEREAWAHVGLRSHVLEGRKPPKRWRPRYPIIIINYDILVDWIAVLERIKPLLVIVDECHKIANPTTQQTKYTKRLCKKVKYVVGISGTPLLSRPAELFPMLNIIRPDKFNSFHSFGERFCGPRLRPWGREYKGATNLSELRRLLNRTCMIRRTKDEVLGDLPPKARHVVTLRLSNRKEYNEAVHNFIGWLSKQSAKKAKKAQKAERLVQMGYMKRLAARLKLKAVLDWIECFLNDTNEKLILFGVHKSIIAEIHERFKKVSVVVDGSVTGRKRQAAVDRFNNVKACRLFIGNIKAAGVGWSCTSASVTAFFELGWTPGEHTQAEDRTHGIKRGQKGKVSRSYYLVGSNTIEEHLCQILQAKQRTVGEALDGGTRGEALDIFDLLTRKLVSQSKQLS